MARPSTGTCRVYELNGKQTMASTTHRIKGALYKRSVKQGRKPQGLSRWNGRLTTASLEELKAKAKMLEPYYTVNDLVRIAVDRYVCTELLNP